MFANFILDSFIDAFQLVPLFLELPVLIFHQLVFSFDCFDCFLMFHPKFFPFYFQAIYLWTQFKDLITIFKAVFIGILVSIIILGVVSPLIGSPWHLNDVFKYANIIEQNYKFYILKIFFRWLLVGNWNRHVSYWIICYT